jgi:multiple sugar transport system substrate-binding protein
MQHDVRVSLIRLPEGTYADHVAAAALSGNLPDALDFDGPNLYNYASVEHLMPIDRYVSSEMREDFLPSIIAQGTYQGRLYSLGQYDSGLAIWGNRAYLSAAGVRIPTSVDDAWTFTEFENALSALQALADVEYAIDLKMNYGRGEWYTYAFSPILQSFGADLIDRSDFGSASGVLNGQHAVSAMQWFKSLFENGYADPNPTTNDTFYGTKTSALSYVGHWQMDDNVRGLGQDNVVLIPMFKGPRAHVSGMGSWNWGITSTTGNPDAVWAFLEFLLSPDQILRMTDANGAVPARRSALRQRQAYQPGGWLHVFRQQLDLVAVPRPQTEAYPIISAAFQTAVEDIVGGSDIQQALDAAVVEIDSGISR